MYVNSVLRCKGIKSIEWMYRTIAHHQQSLKNLDCYLRVEYTLLAQNNLTVLVIAHHRHLIVLNFVVYTYLLTSPTHYHWGADPCVSQKAAWDVLWHCQQVFASEKGRMIWLWLHAQHPTQCSHAYHAPTMYQANGPLLSQAMCVTHGNYRQ